MTELPADTPSAEDLEHRAVWTELVERRVEIDGYSRYYKFLADSLATTAKLTALIGFGSSLGTVGSLLATLGDSYTTAFAVVVAVAQVLRYGIGQASDHLVPVCVTWRKRSEAYSIAIFRMRAGKPVTASDVERMRREDLVAHEVSAKALHIPWLVRRYQKRSLGVYAVDFEAKAT